MLTHEQEQQLLSENATRCGSSTQYINTHTQPFIHANVNASIRGYLFLIPNHCHPVSFVVFIKPTPFIRVIRFLHRPYSPIPRCCHSLPPTPLSPIIIFSSRQLDEILSDLPPQIVVEGVFSSIILVPLRYNGLIISVEYPGLSSWTYILCKSNS